MVTRIQPWVSPSNISPFLLPTLYSAFPHSPRNLSQSAPSLRNPSCTIRLTSRSSRLMGALTSTLKTERCQLHDSRGSSSFACAYDSIPPQPHYDLCGIMFESGELESRRVRPFADPLGASLTTASNYVCYFNMESKMRES